MFAWKHERRCNEVPFGRKINQQKIIKIPLCLLVLNSPTESIFNNTGINLTKIPSLFRQIPSKGKKGNYLFLNHQCSHCQSCFDNFLQISRAKSSLMKSLAMVVHQVFFLSYFVHDFCQLLWICILTS